MAVHLIDIESVRDIGLPPCSIYLNRVYGSATYRNPKSVARTLEAVEHIERSGIICVNGLLASRCDYSKALAADLMRAAGVRTPKTMLVESLDSAIAFAETHGYPLIIKPDSGGRALGVELVKSEEKLRSLLASCAESLVLQSFVLQTENFDCRVATLYGDASTPYARSLIPQAAGETPWMGSYSAGSELFNYNAPQEAIELGLAAADAIGAVYSEVDVAFDKDGPIVIEVNPTPNYLEEDGSRIRGIAARILECNGFRSLESESA